MRRDRHQDDWLKRKGSGDSAGRLGSCRFVEIEKNSPASGASLRLEATLAAGLDLQRRPACPDAVELSHGSRASHDSSGSESHHLRPTNCLVLKYQDLGE